MFPLQREIEPDLRCWQGLFNCVSSCRLKQIQIIKKLKNTIYENRNTHNKHTNKHKSESDLGCWHGSFDDVPSCRHQTGELISHSCWTTADITDHHACVSTPYIWHIVCGAYSQRCSSVRIVKTRLETFLSRQRQILLQLLLLITRFCVINLHLNFTHKATFRIDESLKE